MEPVVPGPARSVEEAARRFRFGYPVDREGVAVDCDPPVEPVERTEHLAVEDELLRRDGRVGPRIPAALAGPSGGFGRIRKQ